MKGSAGMACDTSRVSADGDAAVVPPHEGPRSRLTHLVHDGGKAVEQINQGAGRRERVGGRLPYQTPGGLEDPFSHHRGYQTCGQRCGLVARIEDRVASGDQIAHSRQDFSRCRHPQCSPRSRRSHHADPSRSFRALCIDVVHTMQEHPIFFAATARSWTMCGRSSQTTPVRRATGSRRDDLAPFLQEPQDDCQERSATQIVPQSAQQEPEEVTGPPDLNPICEWFVGSVWRKCLDHVVILNEVHLRRVVQEYGLKPG